LRRHEAEPLRPVGDRPHHAHGKARDPAATPSVFTLVRVSHGAVESPCMP